MHICPLMSSIRVERFLDHFYPLILIANSKMFLNVKVLHRLGWVGISRGAALRPAEYF